MEFGAWMAAERLGLHHVTLGIMLRADTWRRGPARRVGQHTTPLTTRVHSRLAL
jgi:hypothetical protein